MGWEDFRSWWIFKYDMGLLLLTCLTNGKTNYEMEESYNIGQHGEMAPNANS